MLQTSKIGETSHTGYEMLLTREIGKTSHNVEHITDNDMLLTTKQAKNRSLLKT